MPVSVFRSLDTDRDAVIPEGPAEAHRPNAAHPGPGGLLPLRPQPLDPLQTGGCHGDGWAAVGISNALVN